MLKRLLLILFFCSGYAFYAHATHIRAGEITAKYLGNYTYLITLTVYTDSATVVVNSALDTEPATIYFGDGSSPYVAPRDSGYFLIGYNTKKNIYYATHTYGGPGVFKISFQEFNRNCAIINFDNNGCQTPFYIETQITIDPSIGSFSTPVLTVPPVDKANINQIFTTNPGAYDADGDSLSYNLGIPQTDSNTLVPGYVYPANYTTSGKSTTGGPPFFSINSKTGEITWNVPVLQGTYDVVIYINIFRNGVQIGYVMRDMQIFVNASNNQPPVLKIPKDTCINAGQDLKATITATDPIKTVEVNLYAYGGPFTTSSSPATATLPHSNPQAQPGVLLFDWKTTCANIQQQPYTAIFKATDEVSSTIQLADIETWNIRVLGPRPTGLQAIPNGNSMVLTWNQYACSSNATYMGIYRKVCQGSFSSDSCQQGVPASSGFVQVGLVRGNAVTFTDDNLGSGLKHGIYYCYVIAAEFDLTETTYGKPSSEACAYLDLDVPIPLKISVTKTDPSKGKILAIWHAPIELDTVAFPGGYRYELYRLTGPAYNNPVLVYNAPGLKDTVYTDSLLNTQTNLYEYYVKFYYKASGLVGGQLKYTSDTASSVQLTGVAANDKITLVWTWNTPWINAGQYVYIYRKTDTTSYVLIDSILTTSDTSMVFTDNGLLTPTGKLTPYQNYTYFVVPQGVYNCKGIIVPPLQLLPARLQNASNTLTLQPVDSIPPCPPILSITQTNCDSFVYAPPLKNHLYWQNQVSLECQTQITGYNLYYAANQTDPVSFLINLPAKPDTTYDHFVQSLAGCYEVTATGITPDGRKLESAKSNKVCNDNCPFFELPNVFTPNNDGVNDGFSPKPIPRFVASVKTLIYNRWGRLVLDAEQAPPINSNFTIWEANNVPDGVYFYYITVKYVKLTDQDNQANFKGWVQVIK